MFGLRCGECARSGRVTDESTNGLEAEFCRLCPRCSPERSSAKAELKRVPFVELGVMGQSLIDITER